LIVTNPPMGRRVVHHRELPQLLDRFVAHAAEVLQPGGRLVWISPRPDDGARRAAACGLRLDFERDVDMGGFAARIQRFRKRA
jgi:tRNA G10  N-methylase Trm11